MPERKGYQRRPIPSDERFKVWVRSAGRCAICNAYLLEGPITATELRLGEVAHIVGQQDTPGSPRGASGLTEQERDSAHNLILICASHHDEIDRDAAAKIITVERLQAIKARHENFVRKVTGFEQGRQTVVLRMLGDVRGQPVELSKRTAAAAVLAEERYPHFTLSHDGEGIEIDLRHIASEAEPGAEYWTAATALIDQVVKHKVREGIRAGAISHLSVLAFARLPLLTYLGSALGDNCPVDVFQRRRAPETWEWQPDGAPPVEFTVDRNAELASEEAVLILNGSGTVESAAVPNALSTLPRLTISAAGAAPGVNTIATRADLQAFERAVRSMFSELERGGKVVKRLHVLAALPVSAAIALGRAHDHVHPALVMYHRTEAGVYLPALEIIP